MAPTVFLGSLELGHTEGALVTIACESERDRNNKDFVSSAQGSSQHLN